MQWRNFLIRCYPVFLFIHLYDIRWKHYTLVVKSMHERMKLNCMYCCNEYLGVVFFLFFIGNDGLLNNNVKVSITKSEKSS